MGTDKKRFPRGIRGEKNSFARSWLYSVLIHQSLSEFICGQKYNLNKSLQVTA